ncbi:elongation factor EF-2, partial [Puccinia sorghi]
CAPFNPIGLSPARTSWSTSARLAACAAGQTPARSIEEMVPAPYHHIPKSQVSAAANLMSNYPEPFDSTLAQHTKKCDPAGPLVIQMAKLLQTHDTNEFRSIGCFLVAGTGIKIKILGGGYSVDDKEDMIYSVETSGVTAGNLRIISAHLIPHMGQAKAIIYLSSSQYLI